MAKIGTMESMVKYVSEEARSAALSSKNPLKANMKILICLIRNPRLPDFDRISGVQISVLKKCNIFLIMRILLNHITKIDFFLS